MAILVRSNGRKCDERSGVKIILIILAIVSWKGTDVCLTGVVKIGVVRAKKEKKRKKLMYRPYNYAIIDQNTLASLPLSFTTQSLR